MEKVTAYKKAIDRANSEGLAYELNDLSGFSGKKLLGALQFLAQELDVKNECYLEIGVFQGMTLLSVAKTNEKLSCFGVDNFSQFDPSGKNKNLIETRAITNNVLNYELVEADFEDAIDNMEKTLQGKKIGLYFVDGPHDYRSQLICLEFIKPYLSSNAVIVIDDSNYRHVRQANSDFIKANSEYTLLYENYTKYHPKNGKKTIKEYTEGWWNGVNIIVKDEGSDLDKMLPVTELDRELYFNQHIVDSAKYSYLAPYALDIVKGLLDFNLIDFGKGILRCFTKKNSNASNIHRGKFRGMNVFSEKLPHDNFNNSVEVEDKSKKKMKILITCPPMLGMKQQFLSGLENKGIDVVCPDIVQTLSEVELIAMIPEFDGWIIGDDPATRAVFTAGKSGRLRAAVKWGIGVDNVDFEACNELNIKITNTPNMFGSEVADVAIGYVIGLARELFFIDREVRAGNWPKNRGISLNSKTVGLVGYGDIGQNTARRLKAMGMNVIVYDPRFSTEDDCKEGVFQTWPNQIEKCDFLVFTCALTKTSKNMLNVNALDACKTGVRVVNVARGPLICEPDLIGALRSGKVHSVALDVFEQEPLPVDSLLRDFPLCILGSHNASNTTDAVAKTNNRAINELFKFLDIS